ncbi:MULTISPECIES: polyphenol oxidase family protein [Gordonibacter]|uniref:Polyphenol oxidase family protein n=1 Tax=Gordonibacter faecis TaxID=3047475 RepID=A0ABT7DMV1_9ACTN|nr:MULTISPECIES: polyphenol oxidase family protein [unclassified Gordonibacter]MDJ1650856.1 polyphenol oxidase family protein [Gordonibacter sp. KGMB12511]HIW76112.1 polyphenol oxidase family protein [Candidatus Gordonibacter avicola]
MLANIVELPKPHLDARLFGARRISALTDESLFERTGLRIAFTARGGGVSEAPYDSLNLGSHVDDDLSAVEVNRALLLEALGAADAPLLVPSQVHGDEAVEVTSADAAAVEEARRHAAAGADILVVGAPEVVALLCFADCVPVIVAAPSGRFAVAHAGWRGAVAGVAGKAARLVAAREAAETGVDERTAASTLNAYLGPHIRACCFETGADVREQFVQRFGAEVAPDAHHVDLARAITRDLEQAGVQPSRIADAGVCTVCHSDEYFSYRASGGRCGRHGAFAVLQKG